MAKIGRPTKYRPEMCQEIIDFFFNAPLWEEKEIHHYGKGGTTRWIDIKRFPAKLPTLVGYCKSAGIGDMAVYAWIDVEDSRYQPDFREAYLRAKKAQKEFLIQASLLGLFNPIFAKFTAVNLTDMRDKQDLDIGSESLLDVLNRIHNPGTKKIESAPDIKEIPQDTGSQDI